MRPLSLDIPWAILQNARVYEKLMRHPRKPLFPIAGRPMIWHHIQALSKVDGLTEVLLIGFYDDAVMQPFIRDASRDFPNLAIKCATRRL